MVGRTECSFFLSIKEDFFLSKDRFVSLRKGIAVRFVVSKGVLFLRVYDIGAQSVNSTAVLYSIWDLDPISTFGITRSRPSSISNIAQQNESEQWWTRWMEDKPKSKSLNKNLHHPRVSTPNGSRTRAACLEGKHDNRFTIGVTPSCRMTHILRNSTNKVGECSPKNILQY